MKSEIPSSPWHIMLAVALLVVFAAQAALGSPHNSAAFDEEYHLAAGYVYLRTGDPRLSTEHPPLVNLWNALPLVFLDPKLPLDHPAWHSAITDDFGDAFLWQANPDRAVQLVLLGRWPIIALGVLLGAVVFRWARDLFGTRAGLLALALYAFDPNLIAHSRLSTTDLGLAACMTIAMWRLWAWLEKPARRNLALVGLTAGAAMTTKFTGLTLVPIFALVALFHPARISIQGGKTTTARRKVDNHEAQTQSPISQATQLPQSPKQRSCPNLHLRRFPALSATVFVALFVIWGVYGFEIQAGLPAATYWRGLLKIWGEYSQGYPTFLLGRVSRTGWWYYFPLAFVLKTPLPTQILFVASLLFGLRQRAWRRATAALIPPFFSMLAALFSPLAIGYRHILPLLPFVIIIASQIADCGLRRERSVERLQIADHASRSTQHVSRITHYVLRITFYALLSWLLINAARIFPHHLSYFNELGGSPSNWNSLLVDSNLDWGQDLPALKQLLDERGIEEVYLAYFGTAMPEAYGLTYKPLPGFLRFLAGPEVDAYNPYTPEPGWYAISATSLRLGLVYRQVDLYAYFRDKPPVARAGHSINLYEVRYPEGTPVDRVAIIGWPVAEFTPEQLGLTPGHRLIVKWSKSPDTTVISDQLAVISDQSAVISDQSPISNLQSPTSNLQPPIDFSGAFALIGYRIEQPGIEPGQALSLTLYWEVGSAQVETPKPGYLPPLAMFVHFVGSDPSQIVAQYDGWGTALTGLERGDMIAQRVTLPIPEGALAGAYRLLVGLYSPQSMERLTALLPDGAADHVELSEITIR